MSTEHNKATKRLRKVIYLNSSYSDEYEKSVTCGKHTPVKRNTHVDFRECFSNGGGQLCKSCWHEIYQENNYE